MWKSTTRTRVIVSIVLAAIVILLWSGIKGAPDFSGLVPSRSPFETASNEAQKAADRIQFSSITIHSADLNLVKSTKKASANGERVLILTPLRNAAPYLEQYFNLLADLTYPHLLIDLGFLIGDTTDDTMNVLIKELNRLQTGPDAFGDVMIIEKDFKVEVSQDVQDRHGFAAQGPRRKAMGRARNYLLAATLTNQHSWVHWRDVDIVESPVTLLQDLIAHDRDVIVPNIWFHRGDIEGRFDYNSWQESEQGLNLSASLPKDTIIAEGYAEMPTGRTYMATMGDRHKNQKLEIPLDGVGGVSIMVKADVHRSGINFPCYAFENQAETEGFAKMAKRAGYGVYGLPNYVVWHIDTEEKPRKA